MLTYQKKISRPFHLCNCFQEKMLTFEFRHESVLGMKTAKYNRELGKEVPNLIFSFFIFVLIQFFPNLFLLSSLFKIIVF